MSVLQLARTGWGILELVAPDALVEAAADRHADEEERTAVRVLGVRDVVQAQMTTRRGRAAHGMACAVDVLHAASMVALAVYDERRRRLAGVSAVIASAFALAEYVAARRAR